MNDGQKTKHIARRLTIGDRRRCWRRINQFWLRHQQTATTEAQQ